MFPNDDELLTDEEVDALLGDEDAADALEEDELDDGATLDEETGEIAEELATARTYAIDFTTGKIGGFVDEEDALRQFIVKALLTPRSEHAIYTDDYGSEIEDIIAEQEGQEYNEAELPRIVTEALEDDDRIVSVDDVSVEFIGDQANVVVTVSSIYGEITEEVTLIV